MDLLGLIGEKNALKMIEGGLPTIEEKIKMALSEIESDGQERAVILKNTKHGIIVTVCPVLRDGAFLKADILQGESKHFVRFFKEIIIKSNE